MESNSSSQNVGNLNNQYDQTYQDGSQNYFSNYNSNAAPEFGNNLTHNNGFGSDIYQNNYQQYQNMNQNPYNYQQTPQYSEDFQPDNQNWNEETSFGQSGSNSQPDSQNETNETFPNTSNDNNTSNKKKPRKFLSNEEKNYNKSSDTNSFSNSIEQSSGEELDETNKVTGNLPWLNQSPENNVRPPPTAIDPSWPSDIVALLETNFCGICQLKLNSRIQSKTHYDGKLHAKKLKGALEKKGVASQSSSQQDDVSEPTNEGPPTKKQKTSCGVAPAADLYCPCCDVTLTSPEHAKQHYQGRNHARKSSIATAPAGDLYCQSCDITFTSSEHAKQHYLGRNHARVLHKLKPLKPGYYNEATGKWQRMSVSCS